jgi:hypothetical protein
MSNLESEERDLFWSDTAVDMRWVEGSADKLYPLVGRFYYSTIEEWRDHFLTAADSEPELQDWCDIAGYMDFHHAEHRNLVGCDMSESSELDLLERYCEYFAPGIPSHPLCKC